MYFYINFYPGNLFSNYTFFSLGDIIAYGISKIILDRFGKNVLFLISGGITIVGVLFFFNNFIREFLSLPLIFLIKAGTSMNILGCYLINNRLFPAEILTTTFGLFNFLAHVPTVFIPVFKEYIDPLVIVIIFSFISIFAIRYVEEMSSSKI